MKKNNKIPIIIDTDPGHDDALAIILLEKSELFDIKAVTTVAGNSTIENVTNNARYILNLISSKSPLYSGSRKPLKKTLIQAEVHGESGLDGITVGTSEKADNKAVAKIISLVRENQNQISIVVIGPQTNIAKAFTQDPELPTFIKQLVIMGGAINVPGNKNRVAEFNIFVDPEAAEIVFNAPVRKVLVPLDVCNNIVLNLSDFEKLENTKIYRPIMSMMEKYIEGIEKMENVKGALMYDPLAAYYLINPKAYTLQSMDIKIETNGNITRGMTVADRRNWGSKVPNVEVATQIDKKMFVGDFLQILGK